MTVSYCVFGLYFLLVISLLRLGNSNSEYDRCFENIKKDPTELRIFLRNFPKGAELHNHLAGSSYAELLIQYASKDPTLCLDVINLTVFVDLTASCAHPMSAVARDSSLVSKIIEDWSLVDYVSSSSQFHLEKPEKQFFGSFFKFMNVVFKFKSEILAELLERAAASNVSHLELNVLMVDEKISQIGRKLVVGNFSIMQKQAEAFGIETNIIRLSKEVLSWIAAARSILQCDTPRKRLACDISFGFLYSAARILPINQVFTQVMAIFALADNHPAILGVNFVGPEDDLVSVEDYDTHMNIFQFFRRQHPKVKISLHAGELRQGQILPKVLRSGHIGKAIAIGGAARIGHGVAIAYEPHAIDLVQKMSDQKIAVEICLTSNAKLLGIQGKAHPFEFYKSHGVPLSLNSDDAGVLRTDLNTEFERAVLTYNLTYSDLKWLARNSLEHSFLPGVGLDEIKKNVKFTSKNLEQLWQKLATSQPWNKKALKQWDLEQKFIKLESSRVLLCA